MGVVARSEKGCVAVQTNYPERYKMLGLRIAYYRRKCGYTQETFAKKIGRSQNFVAQVEGPGMIVGVSLETLFTMAEALGVEPGKLLEND